MPGPGGIWPIPGRHRFGSAAGSMWIFRSFFFEFNFLEIAKIVVAAGFRPPLGPSLRGSQHRPTIGIFEKLNIF